MALELNKTISIIGKEVVFEKCYIVVKALYFSKKGSKAIVETYTSTLENIISTDEYTFNISIDGENFVKQAYEYLKTLEEFKDAKDI